MGALVSRPRTRASGHTSLLKLPAEVQVEILCHLDPDSLVACRLTCRSLSKLFESMAVQYACGLSVSAMTDDGSPGGVSLRDRYAAILQYQHMWTRSDFPRRMQDSQLGSCYLAHSNGVFVYAVRDHDSVTLKLYRPGSARTGLPELTFMCIAWTPLLEPSSLFDARYTVDLSEDLLVITLPGDGSDEQQHHLFSISNDCYLHPLATSSVIRVPRSPWWRLHSTLYMKERDHLDILSDLVAWGYYEDTCDGQKPGIKMEVHITNWKTGAVVWSPDIFLPPH
ncbi:hypothetical protein L226DRAFT_146029 [Lentinus tigrinus ALCF2SS1-7]|uniref:uncharacterized protein n=1 Tax=Lentinus tigrinus ALCF2SS1-7 TaxID=1328758 RepID=UPI001165FC39|nr:hypothetical protein L226DRAFT_146029 [Lentinus tigrinus ALCF2SS1-7]